MAEPAFAGEFDWLLCDGLARLCKPEAPESMYLRLTNGRCTSNRPRGGASVVIRTAP